MTDAPPPTLRYAGPTTPRPPSPWPARARLAGAALFAAAGLVVLCDRGPDPVPGWAMALM